MLSKQTLPFSTAEAVALGTALVAHVAQAQGIRALIVKGPLATQLSIRPEESSSDVDVIVEPQSFDQLVQKLATFGWQERYNFPGHPQIVDQHSVSLSHSQWPCDIDIHHTWPGFFVDSECAFDRLWAAKTELSIAHQPVFLPGLDHHCLIMALHALREPHSTRGRSQYPFILEFLRKQYLGTSKEQDLIREIEELDCVYPLAPLIEDLGLDLEVNMVAPEAMRLWNIRSQHQPSLTWVFAFTEAPILKKPSVIWRAVFPHKAALRYKFPELTSQRFGLFKAWWKRLFLALPNLRKSITIIRQNRHTSRYEGS